jgi:hypothetical protein
MKRSLFHISVANCTRSKKPRLTVPVKPQTNLWLSATKVYNYINNNALCDWLDMYYNKTGNINKCNNSNSDTSVPKIKTFKQYTFDRGNQFEQSIYNKLKCKHGNDMITVSSKYTINSANKTIEYMKNGIPIIYSAPIYSNKLKLFGIADILVRNDYFKDIFNDTQYTDNSDIQSVLGDYYYIVIDIKFCTLPLASDGIHLLNSGNIKSNKSQIFIYTKILEDIQGCFSCYGYLLGRKWSYSSKGISSNGDNYTKLGTVDFVNRDKFIEPLTYDAINWYRQLKIYGSEWDIRNPHHIALYPNMCVDSGKWNSVKREIASELKEITMLWNCGYKQREIAFNNGITRWDNNKCNSRTLGFTKSSKLTNIIDDIIDINKQDKSIINKENIDKDILNTINLYVDFETVTSICHDRQIIFLIGVGWYNDNGEWIYKKFLVNELTDKEEHRIMHEFMMFSAGKSLCYWYAEKNMWKYAQKSNSEISIHYDLNWFDLCDYFKTYSIVMKDCFNFGLKHIVNIMNKHNLINIKMNSNCNNGMMAMITAYDCYKRNDINGDIMKDIIVYNNFDCKTMGEIIKYLVK